MEEMKQFWSYYKVQRLDRSLGQEGSGVVNMALLPSNVHSK